MANEQPTLDQRVLGLEIKVELLERQVSKYQAAFEEVALQLAALKADILNLDEKGKSK